MREQLNRADIPVAFDGTPPDWLHWGRRNATSLLGCRHLTESPDIPGDRIVTVMLVLAVLKYVDGSFSPLSVGKRSPAALAMQDRHAEPRKPVGGHVFVQLKLSNIATGRVSARHDDRGNVGR